MKTDRRWMLLCIVGGLLLFFGGGGLGPLVQSAPFKTDKLAVLIVHDASETTSLPQWANSTTPDSVNGWTKAHGGDFRIIDQKSPTRLLDQKWQDAMAVPRKSVPWIVAANPTRGISQAIKDGAAGEAEAKAALAPLGGP